jgi:outer membrane protein OmpA-like peptidoglycan-associated protein
MCSFTFQKKLTVPFFLAACLLTGQNTFAQVNLLLNGSFEDINVCTEYNAECGVEGWFYLRDIKVQMLSNYDPVLPLGANSYGLYYKWTGYKGFIPVIGTILPCRLRAGKQYTFSGMLAKINERIRFKPGVVIDEKFYVPRRPFSAAMNPDSITALKFLIRKNFYEFEYKFTATGKEKYLTFGIFAESDTSGSRNFFYMQTISMVVDNFRLTPAEEQEIVCSDFAEIKENIYNYNFRHKEMDYSLFGKGELNIPANENDSDYITRIEIPANKTVRADTLKLGDVFFDFNKAALRPEATRMLEGFFKIHANKPYIDSIHIEGHTDSIGTDKRNMQLSLQRCESVQLWVLKNRILEEGKTQIHPFGKTRPISSNATAQGRAMNRRVEIIIFRKEQ